METGEIIPLATPVGKYITKNGGHDPRLFHLQDKIYALLSINVADNWVSTIWDFQRHKPIVPEFSKATPKVRKNYF